MKIAILSPMILGLGKTPQNYTSQQINLARSWAQAGHEVHVITAQKDGVHDALDHEKIRVFTRPALWMGGKKGIPLILLGGWWLIGRGGYDFVFSSEHYQPATAMACLLSKNVVIYQGQNSSGSSKLKRAIFKILDATVGKLVKSRCKCVIAKTAKAKTFLEARGFTHCTVVPCGYDPERFSWPTKEQKQSLRRKYQIGLESAVWVYAGNLLKRRDLPTAIKAFAEYKEKQGDAIFLIAGSGPEKDDILDMAAKKHVADSIRFLGTLEWQQLREVFAVGDLFIFPTKYEIYGMVLLEALACGLRFVSTPCPAAVDIKKECSNAGGIFEYSDSQMLLEKAEDLLKENDESIMNEIERYAQIMTWPQISKRIIDVISVA